MQFLTNTTSRTRASVASTLRDVGIAVDDDKLLTAGVATAAYLRDHHPDARSLVLNDGPLDDLAGITLAEPGQEAAVVVIGSAGPSFSWEALNLSARGDRRRHPRRDARLGAVTDLPAWLGIDAPGR